MNLAVAGRPHGILVNAVSPVADTRMALAVGVTQEELDGLPPAERRAVVPNVWSPLSLYSHMKRSAIADAYSRPDMEGLPAFSWPSALVTST